MRTGHLRTVLKRLPAAGSLLDDKALLCCHVTPCCQSMLGCSVNYFPQFLVLPSWAPPTLGHPPCLGSNPSRTKTSIMEKTGKCFILKERVSRCGGLDPNLPLLYTASFHVVSWDLGQGNGHQGGFAPGAVRYLRWPFL